jgi:hypothetical protein
VLRVAAAYALVAWIIIEAEDTGDWGSLRAKAEVIYRAFPARPHGERQSRASSSG